MLPHQVKRWLADFVRTRIQERNPETYPELLELLESQYALPLCADSLGHITRNMKAFNTVLGRPMEVARAAVNPDEIHE
jgi:hypothetical protein